MSGGYIKIQRDFIETWHDKPNVCAMYLHLMSSANIMAKEWQGMTVNRGEFVTSKEKLAQALNLSVRQVRTILSCLSKDKRIAIESTKRWTKIIICDYDCFENKQPMPEIIDSSSAHNPSMDGKKNTSVSKASTTAKREHFSKPSIDEVREYCSSKKSCINADEFWNFYESKGWLIGKSPMKNWHAAIASWERKRTSASSGSTILTNNSIDKYNNDITW